MLSNLCLCDEQCALKVDRFQMTPELGEEPTEHYKLLRTFCKGVNYLLIIRLIVQNPYFPPHFYGVSGFNQSAKEIVTLAKTMLHFIFFSSLSSP